jgi:hypothetical protein
MVARTLAQKATAMMVVFVAVLTVIPRHRT